MAMPPGYSRELLHVKVLLLRKQYQQCIKACLEVLRSCNDKASESHPLSAVFATFYLGLAYNELARSMHEHSALKIPTFQQAEQHYRQTINILPTVEQCRAMLVELDRDAKTVVCDDSQSLGSPLPSEPSTEFTDSQRLSMTLEIERPLQPANNPPGSPKDSDGSNYDSEDSFDDILTPHRVLKRDVSRMSLLDRPLQRDYSSMSLIDAKPKLNKSTSQGLLRPIRPGSPPKQYHLPPMLPYYGQTHQPHQQSRLQASRLPPQQTTSTETKPPPLTMAAFAYSLRVPSSPAKIPSSSPGADLDLPISPVNSHDLPSELSAVSPVSPQTPSIRVQRPSPTPDIPDFSLAEEASIRPYDLSVLAEHLAGIQTQLQTHLNLLQRARLATTVAQAERASRSNVSASTRLAGFTNRESTYQSSHAGRSSKSVPQSKSFWSFTPVDVKMAAKQKRIERGRDRRWVKKRYQSGKYVALVESALAEL